MKGAGAGAFEMRHSFLCFLLLARISEFLYANSRRLAYRVRMSSKASATAASAPAPRLPSPSLFHPNRERLEGTRENTSPLSLTADGEKLLMAAGQVRIWLGGDTDLR